MQLRTCRCWVTAVLLSAALPGAAAGPAAGSLEEFDSWDLGIEETDDEYGLDLFFAAFRPDWERAWRSAREGARLTLGCVTRERWEMLTQVRLRRALHPRARFRYDFVQEQRLSLDNMQHAFGFEVESGGFWLGAYGRPHAAKERHDFGLTARRVWSQGYHLDAAYSFEDLLNDFWTERSFVEERERIDHLNRAREWRLGGGRRWSDRRWLRAAAVILPESRQRIQPAPSSGDPPALRTLDGSFIELEGELDRAGVPALTFRLARKASRVAETAGAAASDLRRLGWLWRAGLTHPLHGRWEAVWTLQGRRNREQDVTAGDPLDGGDGGQGSGGRHRLRVREFMGTAGVQRRMLPWLRLELGYAHQDVNVKQDGPNDRHRFTHGTRSEARLYLGGDLDLRGLRVRVVETLEVDGESYDVVGVHDKGFIQIQAAF